VLGTNEEPAASSAALSIFPNPAASNATVRFNAPVQNAQLSRYNIHGQLVRTIEKVSGSEAAISRDDLVPGLYFVEVSEGEKGRLVGTIGGWRIKRAYRVGFLTAPTS
jgi:hypothetical protein